MAVQVMVGVAVQVVVGVAVQVVGVAGKTQAPEQKMLHAGCWQCPP